MTKDKETVRGDLGYPTRRDLERAKAEAKEPLNDYSDMPFGKYKGTQLADVPSNYLAFLHECSWVETDYPELFAYIEERLG